MNDENKREIYTDKNYLDLSEDEKIELKAKLKSASYYDDEGVHIARNRSFLENKKVFEKEIKLCKILHSLGHEVYLLPSQYAYDSVTHKTKTTSDTITDDEFLELKTTKAKKIEDAYKKARIQAKDAAIDILSDVSEDNAINDIFGAIKLIKESAIENGKEVDFSAKIYIHFDKKDKTILLELDNTGIGRLTNPSFVKNADKNRSNPTRNSIPQEQESVKQKYDDLHAKVYEHCTITFDDKKRDLANGLLDGYCDARQELDKWQSMTPKDLRKLANEMEKRNNKNIER